MSEDEQQIETDFSTRVQGWISAQPVLLWWSLAAVVVAVTVFWWFTPSGLLGKADAVGYAVCHRITVRSFAFPDGVQLPMCARCSGTFTGVLIGLLGPGLLFGRRRAGAFPPLPIMVFMLAFSAWWAFDGANSFTHLLPDELPIPHLFYPNNILRVTTGTFHGITLASIILPIVNATLWTDAENMPTIETWPQVLALWGIGAATILMFLSGWALFLYPLAIISALGTVAILSATTMVMLISVIRHENRAANISEALPYLLLGLTLALVMIGGIDAMRFAVFGSWDGMVF